VANNRIVWSGLEELKRELRNLPTELTKEASNDVRAAANGAAVRVRTEYGKHRVTGRLQESVEVNEQSSGRFGVKFVVRSTDPIAWLFDNGSQARHWVSGKSTGTMWGRTPPTHVFVRTMIKSRREQFEKHKEMLRRHGLIVLGEAA
jgi:hypothetical protein